MENQVIWLKVGKEWPMFALMASLIPDLLPAERFTMLPLLHLRRGR